jgi:hypothetical protein
LHYNAPMPSTTVRVGRNAWVICLAAILVTTLAFANVAAANDLEAAARAFLTTQRLDHALKHLKSDELVAVGQTLRAPNRRLTDKTLARLLSNPAAWETKDNSRPLLGTILKSLPTIAGIEGINSTMKLASNNNHSNFRGYGVEMVGASALNRFITDKGQRAHVTRLGGMIKGIDGRRRESDGAAVLGADGTPRLVTIKSVSTEKAVSGAMRKAADQLALRNLQRDGSRRPGVIVVGYDSPVVRAKLRRKDWQASANRSGAKLLVVGVDQNTGNSEKLAAFMPDPNATIKPKRPGPRPPLMKRFSRGLTKQIGKRSPTAAKRIGLMRSAFKRKTHKIGQSIRSGFRSLFGRKAGTAVARTARARARAR